MTFIQSHQPFIKPINKQQPNPKICVTKGHALFKKTLGKLKLESILKIIIKKKQHCHILWKDVKVMTTKSGDSSTWEETREMSQKAQHVILDTSRSQRKLSCLCLLKSLSNID